MFRTPSGNSASLDSLISPDAPLFIWGPPGIGKTAILRAFARKNGLELYTCILSRWREHRINGIPIPDSEGEFTRMTKPPFFKMKKGILFFDELNLAPSSTMDAALSLIQERENEAGKLSDEVSIVAAGNPPGPSMPSAKPLPPPMASRFLHIQAEPDLDSWSGWAIQQSEAHARIAGFLRTKPSLLYSLPPNFSGQESFPSPRSWDRAAMLLAKGQDISPAVGAAAATEFGAWQKAYRLPRPEEILGNPKLLESLNPIDRWVVITETVGHIVRKKLRDHWSFFLNLAPDEAAAFAGTAIDALGLPPTNIISKLTSWRVKVVGGC